MDASMVQLEDPDFVEAEIDEFERRLPAKSEHKGFSQITR